MVALCSFFNAPVKPVFAATNVLSIQPFAVTTFTLVPNGNFNVPPVSPFNVGSQPQSVAAADVNGDGKVDLISANGDNDPGTLTVLTNDGSGNFEDISDYDVDIFSNDVNCGDSGGCKRRWQCGFNQREP